MLNKGIQENWLTVSWDTDHLLELTIDDVRSQRKFTRLQALIRTCAGLMTKCSYGKQYEILKQAVELTEEKLLQSKRFHATRFVSSELRIMKQSSEIGQSVVIQKNKMIVLWS